MQGNETIVLSKEQKKQLDEQIDGGIPGIGFPNRINALLQFLRYFEKEAAFLSRPGAEQSHDADTSLIMDAMDFCIQWVGRLPDGNDQLMLGSNSSDVDECKRVFDIAVNYIEMSELMTSFHQDLFDVTESPSGTYTFTHKSPLAHQLELADWQLRKLAIPEKAEQVPALDIVRLEKGIDKSKIASESVIRYADTGSLRYVFEWLTAVYSKDWELDGSLVLDGFTLGEYRLFWLALKTLASIATYISRTCGGAGQILYAGTVPIVTRGELVASVSSLSGLDSRLVEAMIDYFTFDFGEQLKARSHACMQPIFALGSDVLALSSTYILEANVERNIFVLLNIKNRSRYDEIKDLKEEEWSNRVVAQLKQSGLVAKAQMKYDKTEKGETKLDLVAVDLVKKIGIVIELKWLIGATFIKKHHRDELAKGFGQAQRACNWIGNNRALTEDKLDLAKGSLSDVEFHPLLVSKDNLMNGHVQHDVVPIICGRLLDWVLKKTNNDLGVLWYVASKRSYLPKKLLHFNDEIRRIPPFNGVTFVRTKSLAGSREWNPDTDIAFSD
jgi:hypothetical protein